MKFTVALSPTFVLVWNVALVPGSSPDSKLHWPRNATSSSGTGAVLAVVEGAAALEVGREELAAALSSKLG